ERTGRKIHAARESICAAEREGARAGLGEGRAGETLRDGAADGQIAAVDGDDAVAVHRDGAGAEVEVIAAAESEGAVPILRVVGGQGDGRTAGVVDRRAAVDEQRAGADGRIQ